jgi:hypothetical protein
MWTVLEFADKGEFFEIVVNAGRLEELLAKKFFRQLALGVCKQLRGKGGGRYRLGVASLALSLFLSFIADGVYAQSLDLSLGFVARKPFARRK